MNNKIICFFPARLETEALATSLGNMRGVEIHAAPTLQAAIQASNDGVDLIITSDAKFLTHVQTEKPGTSCIFYANQDSKLSTAASVQVLDPETTRLADLKEAVLRSLPRREGGRVVRPTHDFGFSSIN